MSGSLRLESSVQFVRGVGPRRADLFAALGIRTVGDLIEHLPFRYELTPVSVAIGALVLGETATIVGELRSVRTGGRGGNITATVVDGTGMCRVVWFNSPYLSEKLHHGLIVRLTAKVDVHRDMAKMTNPKWSLVEDGDDPLAGETEAYAPVYPATAALPSKQIARALRSVIHQVADQVVDPLPDSIRDRRSLPPRRTALLRCHLPTKAEDLPVARRRLAYDELLQCQLTVQLRRMKTRQCRDAPPITTTPEIDARVRRRFPFTLTGGQDRAIATIVRDLARDRPMNRLLHADVGAGKTVVALYAALTVIANGHQAAILAPTEVLARQHFAKIGGYLQGSRVRTELLVGATSKSKRAAVLAGLASGDVHLIVGTHALLEGDVRFAGLGLVVIDEQHKFGVAQRGRLRAKGRAPHLMILTATPIPRTLAMTFFGDLDVSVIDELPPGRVPIETRVVRSTDSDAAWGFVRERLRAGERAYIVYPLVEESDALPLKAAAVEVDRLAQGELAGFDPVLMHGRMKPAEKEQAFARFRSGEARVLVATTVIEVGVDVPEATVMVVQHAERFGLSQIHQLRGRIGRGTRQSYCLLMTDTTEGVAAERMRILAATSDGFRIAEEDLRLRGPGEFLGTRQHGMPTFKVADLVADIDLLEQARDDAADLLAHDATLDAPEHAALKRWIIERDPDIAGSFPTGGG